MVAQNDVPGAGQNREMRKARRAVAADFHVIGVDVERDCGAILRHHRLFVRHELVLLDDQILTATPGRGDAAVLRAVDQTIGHPERLAAGRQHNGAGIAVAQKFDIGDLELLQAGEAAEIQHVFVAVEGIAAGAGHGQGLAERQR